MNFILKRGGKRKWKNRRLRRKIGGARKDLWKTNGLQIEDLKQLNEAEKRRFVTRDSVWPLSNAKALVEQGTEPLVAYWQKKSSSLCEKRTAYSIQ